MLEKYISSKDRFIIFPQIDITANIYFLQKQIKIRVAIEFTHRCLTFHSLGTDHQCLLFYSQRGH